MPNSLRFNYQQVVSNKVEPRGDIQKGELEKLTVTSSLCIIGILQPYDGDSVEGLALDAAGRAVCSCCSSSAGNISGAGECILRRNTDS